MRSSSRSIPLLRRASTTGTYQSLTQLNQGLRVLELDVFYDPQQRLFKSGGIFPVLHVQNIDTASHCANLRECLGEVADWSRIHSGHEPVLVSFNAKTQVIDQPGFIEPLPFDAAAWQAFDAIVRDSFPAALVNPAEVLTPDGPRWPTLAEARGKFLFLLDEGPEKSTSYFAAVANPALFANLPADQPRAAIRVINDPLKSAARNSRRRACGFSGSHPCRCRYGGSTQR